MRRRNKPSRGRRHQVADGCLEQRKQKLFGQQSLIAKCIIPCKFICYIMRSTWILVDVILQVISPSLLLNWISIQKAKKKSLTHWRFKSFARWIKSLLAITVKKKFKKLKKTKKNPNCMLSYITSIQEVNLLTHPLNSV